jgi:hypothetical protein
MAESGEPGGQPSSGGQPSEEELRAQIEEQVRNLRVEDLILQSAISILNISARRIAKEDERDLEQAKLGIDAAADLAERVPEEARTQLKQAVSELQLLYAKHASGEGGESSAEGAEEPAAKPKPEAPKPPEQGGGGASKLWTPGGG